MSTSQSTPVQQGPARQNHERAETRDLTRQAGDDAHFYRCPELADRLVEWSTRTSPATPDPAFGLAVTWVRIAPGP